MTPRSGCVTGPLERCLVMADAHLEGAGPGRERFLQFVALARAERAPLFLLGDIFQYWLGRGHLALGTFDDEVTALAEATREGLPVTVLPGNRDFLLDRTFTRVTGARVAGDSLAVDVAGERLHLSHGDLFSTADLPYQALRRVLRAWPTRFLAHRLPQGVVERLAVRLRGHSERVVRVKSREMLEPDRTVVVDLLRGGFTAVVCGHFHRRVDEVFPGIARGRFIILEPFELRGDFLEIGPQGWRDRWIA